METEIELKFFVLPEFSTQLVDKISAAKILQQSRRELGNVYFDTPDQVLRQHDIGLRIRRFDDVFVQTLKTAGRVVAGLHQRPEYNVEVNSTKPSLALHPVDAWPHDFDVVAVQQQIQPLFSTDFTRQQWLVAMPDGSQIELAFDHGEVSVDDKRSPICEVELELKSGQTDALFTLARELCVDGGMRLGNLSKAARGYRLAADYQGDPIKPLVFVDTILQDSVESTFIKTLEHALDHWLYHEQIYVERQDQQALVQISQALSLLRQTFATFGGIIPRRASALLRQELQWLDGELDWLEEANSIQALSDDKAYVLRKLHARKELQQQLDLRYQELPNSDAMIQLMRSARYCGLLLDLSRWILSRGWQPFLDDKSRTKLAAPIKTFADNMLTRSWSELLDVFPAERQLNRIDYLDQKPRLLRNLMSGIAFAGLYDEDRRISFRMPWLDLLQGLEDLRELEPIRQLLPLFEADDLAQIEKWLQRQEESLLHAMSQTRQISIELTPYWP
ncbi:CYTH domain-containing protein [Photobacterium carnosum]|uniref:CYTH and CHAD domain-containing protein n=1 Tax=Photobacterium carnosum TaxID=2023717 RepID=UPI001E5A51A4|nr:inorganic triphosphatase [Photobacterium carnosum]MCD9495676.1 CYTH domain-containing protein [Photobacterium carnosum]MCD9522912.1 CYTH domain-containing protein [Photobacterium carnosum]MCD9541701.1 CYTH domain-containing protein [Photobacterium carnosum]MCD9549520.1 CYTH domain-containing protein [Photobacterium carnosum]MCF2306675.1 CYTH domain-containing protein [Photobacterium carnosum]